MPRRAVLGRSDPGALVIVGAVVLDALTGEPGDRFHAVSWLGRLIGALERRRPTGRPEREIGYGAGMAGLVVTAASLAGFGVQRSLARLPGRLRLPLTVLALQPAFAVRGLVDAGRTVRRALDADTDEARAELIALVSRDRELDEPHIVSAAVESLAENITDSVTSPLLAYALGGLRVTNNKRAVNTLDAMVGYRGEYEYVGKASALLDDAANYVPARVTGLLICAVAAGEGRGATALRWLRRGRTASSSPNKMWSIAPMAGLLGVQLEKPGAYRIGPAEKPLTPDVIDRAVAVTWRTSALAAAAAAIVAFGRGRVRDAHLARTAAGRGSSAPAVASVARQDAALSASSATRGAL